MAVSAFFIHKRSVDQVLDRLLNLRAAPRPSSSAAVDPSLPSEDDLIDGDGGGGGSYFDSDEDVEIPMDDDVVVSRFRVSSSMPNVGLSNYWFDDQPRELGSRASWDKLNLIPSGLPPLHTARKDGQDHSMNKSGSKIRVGSGGRLMTPRSSCGYAFDSTEYSDEEGTEVSTGQDVLLTYENLNSSAEANNSDIQNVSAPPFEVDNSSCIPDQNCRATANEAKENVDQHGARNADTSSMHTMGNDPIVATNILHQTTTVNESSNQEEEEVWKMIRGCLDLRERYVYRENVAPWMKATGEESSASGANGDPLCFVPVEASAHHFRMEDGVVRVYASENDATELFPVASSTMFFTDMHYLLKVMSIGNVRSACHHRLRFLEEVISFRYSEFYI